MTRSQAPSKYRAVPTVVDGIRFDSKAESRRWCELRIAQMAGRISGLERQVPWPIEINGVKVGVYTCDFTYREGDEFVVEDVKGFFDPAAKLRIKIVEALYGIKVRITGASKKRAQRGRRAA